jgi:hypothetical protein
MKIYLHQTLKQKNLKYNTSTKNTKISPDKTALTIIHNKNTISNILTNILHPMSMQITIDQQNGCEIYQNLWANQTTMKQPSANQRIIE